MNEEKSYSFTGGLIFIFIVLYCVFGRSEIDDLNSKIDEMEYQIDSLEQEHEESKTTIKELESKIKDLEFEMFFLKN